MENNQPKKKNAGLTALIALLLVITTVASCFGIWAWARYISSQQGNATAEIAKWSFDLKLKNGSAEETAGPIDLAQTLNFQHVKSDTIAPGTNGQFQVIVNTTGTEVDCQYDVTIALSNCPRNITFSRVDENNVTTELSAGGASNELTRTLTFSKYLSAKPTNQNGRHVETITWNWPYEADANETAANKTAWDDRDNEDENNITGANQVVTMQITATGTEMLENATANTVQGQAQAGHIQQWDSVNYNPGTTTTASIDLPEGASIEGSKLAAISLPSGASLNGTISANSASNWVVLDVNETTGEVRIIPKTYSLVGLSLSGMNGYNNAIQALDAVAGIYKNDAYATSSKSLTVDDVNGVEGYDPTEVVSASASGNGETTYSWNQRYGMAANLNIIDYGENKVAERTYTSTPTTKYYSYTTTDFNNHTSGRNWNCWLASRCVDLGSSGCGFNVRYLRGDSVSSVGLFGVSSGGGTGDDGSGSYPVVPVVTLKSTVKMNKVNGTWELSL